MISESSGTGVCACVCVEGNPHAADSNSMEMLYSNAPETFTFNHSADGFILSDLQHFRQSLQ